MSHYTICPNIIAYAKTDICILRDVLWVFIPNNSKKVCIDKNEKLITEYKKVMKGNRDLVSWLDHMNKFQSTSFEKIDVTNSSGNLALDICLNTIDKKLIVESKNSFHTFLPIIKSNEVTLIEKDYAGYYLNYNSYETLVQNLGFELPVTPKNAIEAISHICNNFKYFIEKNGVFKLFFNDKRERVSEKNAQLIFYVSAISFCASYDIKLSPEVNSGNGPVDFNFSNGNKANINVEIKFADNPELEHGFTTQLKIYNEAERTADSIYLIIKTDDKFDKRIQKIGKDISNYSNDGLKVPRVIIIDAQYKESASKRNK